jgi:hypothetical protein
VSDEGERERGLEILASLVERGNDALEGLARAERARFVERLYTSWIAGTIPPAAVGADDAIEANRRIGRAFRALPSALTDPLSFERTERDEMDVRRWCWVPGWYLMSQDEDLLLMDDDYVAALCQEASEGCTKRKYALSIVEHHARDGAHHALWDGAERLEEHLEKVGSWAALAHAADAPELAAYLERLGRYAEPRAVDQAEVRQRVLDLRRCHANEGVAPSFTREGDRWVARLDRANVTEGRLVIEAATGRMWAEEVARRE